MYDGNFANGKKNGRGILHLPYGDDINTIWENDVESKTFEEGKRKSAITITIYAHGADIDFMPDDRINLNVRILAAAGSCGMNYIQADRVVNNLVKAATDHNFFNPKFSTFENLEKMQKTLYSIQYNKEITDKSNKYIIISPVMEHIYALTDTSEYKDLRHITVVDIRNNTNTDIQVGMHLENIDIKNIFTPFIPLTNNVVFKQLYYGPREWASYIRIHDITSNSNIINAFNIIAKHSADDLHLFLSLLMTSYMINNKDKDKDINPIVKDQADSKYDEYAEVDAMRQFNKYNKEMNNEFYLTELLDYLQKYYDIINIIDMSCRGMHETNPEYSKKEKKVSKSINRNHGGLKTRRKK